MEEAVTAAAAAGAAAASAAAASDAAATTATVAATTTTKERPLTARHREGAELRDRLKKVISMQSIDRTREAAAALDAIPAGKMTTGAKGRARELRGTLFTFGGLALTKDIVARFLRAPEVRMLLPEEFQKTQQRAKDAEVEKRLLEAAKAYFRDLMKVKGKTGRCCSAAHLLPAATATTTATAYTLPTATVPTATYSHYSLPLTR